MLVRQHLLGEWLTEHHQMLLVCALLAVASSTLWRPLVDTASQRWLFASGISACATDDMPCSVMSVQLQSVSERSLRRGETLVAYLATRA